MSGLSLPLGFCIHVKVDNKAFIFFGIVSDNTTKPQSQPKVLAR
jgi:hypothetical protein